MSDKDIHTELTEEDLEKMTFGELLIYGLREAVAWEQGDPVVRARTRVVRREQSCEN